MLKLLKVDKFFGGLHAVDNVSIEILQEGEALPIQEPWKSMENSGTW